MVSGTDFWSCIYAQYICILCKYLHVSNISVIFVGCAEVFAA